MQFNVASIIVT